MGTVTREQLHYNFLKYIVVRLDFQGVLESEMEKVLLEIKPYLKELGFNRYEEKLTSEMEIKLPSILEHSSVVQTNKVKSQKIYSFVNETKGFVLDISSTCICLNINSTQYVAFEEYCEYIRHIAEIYKKNIDFFTVKRFGLRKINQCFMFDKEKINEYFSDRYFSFFDAINNIDNKISSKKDIFVKDIYNINLSCDIIQGQSDRQMMYSVAIDIDIYLDDSKEIENVLYNQESINKMNELLFEVYVSSLKDNLISALSDKNDFIIDDIKGVSKNE